MGNKLSSSRGREGFRRTAEVNSFHRPRFIFMSRKVKKPLINCDDSAPIWYLTG